MSAHAARPPATEPGARYQIRHRETARWLIDKPKVRGEGTFGETEQTRALVLSGGPLLDEFLLRYPQGQAFRAVATATPSAPPATARK